jgi:hypothetical protein
MKQAVAGLALILCLSAAAPTCSARAPAKAKPTAREALQPFQDLIGSWRGTGSPAGTREERDKGFWQETITWQWQFKGADAWLRADLEKGKHFTRLELRYLPASESYRLKAWTAGKEEQTFEGKLKKRRLTVTRTDEKAKQTQQLVFSLLHSNRYLYRYEVKPADNTVFTQVFQVGATKKGVAFASDDGKPECVVSGGLGTMPVSYKGKTFYVCCTGCRDAFNEEPEKYIKEFEARKKAKKTE